MVVNSDGFTDSSGTIRYMDPITYNFNVTIVGSEYDYGCPVKELIG